MKRRAADRWRSPIVTFVLLLSFWPAQTGAGTNESDRSRVYAGRPLAVALDDLRARGLNLIFSSDLVTSDMIVATEPPVAAPRQVLEKLLAPFGLEATNGPAGTVLVVRSTRPEPAPLPDAQNPPIHTAPFLREQVKVDAPPDTGPESRHTVPGTELRRLPTIGDDATRGIAGLPGIASGDKSAQVGVRGGLGDETHVVLDGLEIDEPYHLKDFLGFSSLIDARSIGRADVLTGVFPAEYGDTLGGIVDLSTTEPDDAAGTTAGFSLVNSSFSSAGRLGDRGGFLVSARSWYPDAVLDVVDPGGEDISPTYNDLLGKAQMRLPDGSLLSAHFLAARDAVDYRIELGAGRVQAGDDQQYTWLDWKKPFTPRLYAETLVSASHVRRGRQGAILDPDESVVQVEDNRSYALVGLKQDWMLASTDRSLLKWGFIARSLEAEYDYRSHVERTTIDSAGPVVTDRDLFLEPSGTELGAYFAWRLRVVPSLSIEFGARRDRRTLTDETGTSPRVDLAWSVGERTVLRAGWGLFRQAQGINELQIEDGVIDFSPAQRAERRELGLEHRFAGGLTFDVSAYVQNMDRVRPRYENLFDPMELFPETETDRVRIAPDRALARGVEIDLSRDRGGAFSWRAAYALASAEDEIDGAWVPRSWDQRHAFNFNVGYRRGERWDVSVGGVYHSGWPTTGMTAEQVQNPDGSFIIRPIAGPRNSRRFPPYHRVDLKVTRHFEVGGGKLAVYLDVTNLYGRDNVCCARDFQFLPQADGSVRVDRTDGYWLRQLPVVGLIWNF